MALDNMRANLGPDLCALSDATAVVQCLMTAQLSYQEGQHGCVSLVLNSNSVSILITTFCTPMEEEEKNKNKQTKNLLLPLGERTDKNLIGYSLCAKYHLRHF